MRNVEYKKINYSFTFFTALLFISIDAATDKLGIVDKIVM